MGHFEVSCGGFEHSGDSFLNVRGVIGAPNAASSVYSSAGLCVGVVSCGGSDTWINARGSCPEFVHSAPSKCLQQ